MKHFLLPSLLAILLLPAASAAAAPSEAEIKKSIEKAFNETYIDKVVWRITKITCEFGPIKMGQQTRKQMQYGKEAEPVWPVKVEVKVTQYRDDKVYKTVTRGTESRDVFFFYKDAFDEWQFKTGSL